MRRVVITGMAALTPIGHVTNKGWQMVSDNLKNQKGGICYQADWEKYAGLNTKLAAPILDFQKPAHFPRKATRSMGRVALLSVVAAEQALIDANLLNDAVLRSGRTGISFGSSSGSPDAVKEFGSMLNNFDTKGINATTYIRMMSHSAAVNMGVFYGIQGRIIPTSSACTSGSQGIGYAYEAIKYGLQDVMLAGGAEELCGSQAAVFDTLFATSRMNDRPDKSPRPFDKDRDGLVVGEGAGVLILEEYEHAKARGATIHAEIIGFCCNSDGMHITQPNTETIQKVIEGSLEMSPISAKDIGYISAHGTATEFGDIAESVATYNIFANNTPISSLKSYMGHTLGACGAIEAILSIQMQNAGWFCPTKNLQTVDERCADLDYIVGDIRKVDTQYIMSNNFAFGGINTSLIFAKL